jgi:hypothetical protein
MVTFSEAELSALAGRYEVGKAAATTGLALTNGDYDVGTEY